MRKIRLIQGHYEWKLCFLAGCLRGSNAPLNTKPRDGDEPRVSQKRAYLFFGLAKGW